MYEVVVDGFTVQVPGGVIGVKNPVHAGFVVKFRRYQRYRILHEGVQNFVNKTRAKKVRDKINPTLPIIQTTITHANLHLVLADLSEEKISAYLCTGSATRHSTDKSNKYVGFKFALRQCLDSFMSLLSTDHMERSKRSSCPVDCTYCHALRAMRNYGVLCAFVDQDTGAIDKDTCKRFRTAIWEAVLRDYPQIKTAVPEPIV